MSHEDKTIMEFLNEGVFPEDTVIYFDPPLQELEMYQLFNLFKLKNIEGSEEILNPLDRSTKFQKNANQLVWLEVDINRISGWQNVDWVYEDVSYLLDNEESYRKWFKENHHGVSIFINGRKLINQNNTEDLFNQIHENKLNEIGGKRAKDTHVIYRDPNLVVVVPLSFESAKSFSRGTRYCTGGDCSKGSEESSKDMFKQHTSKGDILFRLFFKNGTKIRLTWNGDINDKDFHWGLGRKDSYPTFSSRNMSNPFDIEQIREIRLEQLEFEFEVEPRMKKFEEWEKKFASKWGWDCHDIEDVFKKIKKKWGVPGFRDPVSKPLSPEDHKAWQEEETKVYETFLKKKKEFLGKYYGKNLWWGDGQEALYRSISSIPQEAISKMIEYVLSGKYKPLTESEDDTFSWVEDLGRPKIDKNSLNNLGDYTLIPLRIEDLKEGLIIKRRTGAFIYEIGPEIPLNFKDINTGEKLSGEMGFMLINLTNGKKYPGRKHQITKEFYKIEFK